MKESREKWNRENPEKYRAYKKAKDKRNYARHREEKRQKRAIYAEKHRKEALLRVRYWRENNRERCNTINANRRAREQGAQGEHTVGEWETLKKQYGFVCRMCGKREPEIKLTRDHIIPLSRGGSNYIENIQPLCGKCNCTKWAKLPEDISVSE